MPDLELNSRERHQLLAILRELDPAAPPESRKHERRRVALDLTVQKLGSSSRISLLKGKLVNVSAKGLGLLVAKPLAPGDRLAIPLRFDDGSGWLALCEVRNSKPQPSGQFRAGLTILERIEDPDANAKVPLDWLP